ncbi:OmpA family protein [Methylobacterium symbioticum]|jgi:outer membrane protein OmpA-like peptidoglycan-associated protein|uniref:Outer membrane porin F n=1 Tax=Methylobacterium symbioticum TaxID=2584084 RepID=A0A509EEP9_9HYPH|nr:OmpA family protein [Methylobacterium symbioticum]VUD72610.1 Outer membrane porin F [Methylobacterium symbioticum]
MFGSSRSGTHLFVGAVLAVLASAPASAEDVSEAQILKALSPNAVEPPRTRGLSIGAPAPAVAPVIAASPDAAFVDGLRNKPSRSLSTGEREKLGSLAATKPQIDLPMEFDYNSDVLRGEALKNADNLGKALSSAGMRGQTFMIAGHTDARGGDAANQRLSERRADAVKSFLVQKYGIPAANLITVGYGKAHLKVPADPASRENRRVQAVNMMQVQTAGR